MMTIALNKRLVIINGENSTGSGILINNQGLILSCYHNFYNQETDEERIVKQISIHSTGAWFDIQHSKNIEFCFNEKKYDELKFDDAFLLRLKLDKDSSQLKDIDKLLISRDVNENDEVTIIAWDNVYDKNLVEHSGKVLSIEPATKDHPNRFHVKVDGYPGYSGGGVFKNGQLIGIINYIQTQRQNNIIASFIPNYIVRFIKDEILRPAPNPPNPPINKVPDSPSKEQPFITFRQGAISTSTVAFISIKGLKEIGGIDSVELLAKLHSSIKSIIDKNSDYKGIDVLSSLLGAIILFSDSLQLDPLKLIISINNEMHSCGIPIRIGMSHGDIQELVDIDGKANFIGVAINHSARLATSNKNPGLLVHDVLANHLQSKLRSSHWLSARNSSRLFIEVEGKRDEKFNCYYPPESIWPTQSTITYQYDEQFQPISKNAAIISYDLPNFSDGDLNQLSQRFRAITDVFLALAAQTKLPLEYFYFSPGGDGGVMVFADLNKKTVYDLANNFAERLAIESQNRSSLISVQCRIGLHYGTILLYENAVASLRPTGDDIFIADSITSDEEAKKAGKLIFTEPFKNAVSGGDNRYFEANFYSLLSLTIFDRDINRYSNTTSNSTNTTTLDLLAKIIKGEATYDALRSSSKIANNHVVNSPTVPTSLFEFETVKVDVKGKITKRLNKQAKQFTEDLSNGVVLEMVEIPGGTFLMGSLNDKGFEYETPQHQVTIPALYIGKYQVTQKQWKAIMVNNLSYFKENNNLPVETVSWKDAVEFCKKLSEKTKKSYRLPSEAEWEYACRAGSTTAFAFGETITPDIVNYDSSHPYGETPKGDDRGKTIPVGSLGVANDFGLYDMHGNVWEWCQDTWHNNYHDAPTDGSAWETLSSNNTCRLLRGGSYSYNSFNCRSAFRLFDSMDLRYKNYGLRVVMTT